jgi:hypothetical protein
VTAGKVLEPFLGAIGYGKFCIRPSPFCGYVECSTRFLARADTNVGSFATFLMNFDEAKSTPLSRFINFKNFYFEMLPLLKELESTNLGMLVEFNTSTNISPHSHKLDHGTAHKKGKPIDSHSNTNSSASSSNTRSSNGANCRAWSFQTWWPT